MTAGLNRNSLNTLATEALDAAGLPVVPELKNQLQNQLAAKLLPGLEELVNQPTAAFTTAILDQLRAELSQQLAKTFEGASLAAIAELALPQHRTAPQSRTLSPEVLAGMSETPIEETTEETAPTTQFEPEAQAPSTMTEPGSEAMTAGPGGSAPSGMPSTKPRPKQPAKQPGQQRGDQPVQRQQPSTAAEPPVGTGTAPVVGAPAAADATGTSSAAPAEGAIGQPQPEAQEEEGPGEEQTVEQYREQAVASALHREKKRRIQAGQANMSTQGEDAHQRGLNIIANEGAQIGNKLKNNIKTGHFSSFILCLALALMKDIIEPIAWFYFDPGITGDVLSVFIGGLLTALLLGEGTFFRRWLVKKFLGKALIAFIASLIPGVNVVFPEYTVGVLLMGYDNFQAIQRLVHTLAAHNASMKTFERIAKLGPKAGPHKLGKIRQQLSSHRQIADE